MIHRADPARPDELVVMSWGGAWDHALRHAVSQPFEACTGIRVRHQLHVGLDLPSCSLDADKSGGSPIAVVWSNSVAGMRAANAGLCRSLDPDKIPNLGKLHPRAKPDGFDGWPIVMVYSVAYVLVYRRSLFAAGPPDSWLVLLNERHRGKVALYPHGNGIHAVAQVLGGGLVDAIPQDMAPCWRFLHELRHQVHALDYSGGIVESLRSGELDLCFRALPNAIGFQRAGLDVGWVAPREGVPDTMDCLWVPHNLPPNVAHWATKYIDFALSAPIQEAWCGLLGTVPVHRDSKPHPLLGAASRTPCTLDDQDSLLYIPDTIKLAHDEEWRRKFASIFA